MRRTFLLALIGILAATLFILPACDSGGGGGGTTQTLVGTWSCIQATNPADIGETWTFYADGTGLWNGAPIVYTYNGSLLTVNNLIKTFTFTVAWVNDNRIQLTNTINGEWKILIR